ncbi:methyl-accepting chemotaxis protein [Prosthecomicrobium sp. N25]|uniref:methyl-accepting chemotaxis protein n=1 Tax=Prosthecomicrobium sp. N25 TaxID=3129254 RepID=UPI00307866C0
MANAVQVDDVLSGAIRAKDLTEAKIAQIRAITGRLRILALNAMIEATQAGAHGRGFAVVAQEVRNISTEVERISGSFASELVSEIAALETLTRRMAEDAQGARLVDLALNAVELIDRNLYERSCDVRWWATDSAVVEALAAPGPEAGAHASLRLGVILDAYTVYLDLWLCDMDGRVVANGRPDRHRVQGLDVRDRPWFQKGRLLASGNDYAVTEVDAEPGLGRAQVATYAASVREDGDAHGRPLGILAIHFDWEPQARAIVQGVRLGEGERDRTRVLLVDRAHRVIAASDGRGLLTERFPLRTDGALSGSYGEPGSVVAFHHTPGYETYQGLGWYGVIVQRTA